MNASMPGDKSLTLFMRRNYFVVELNAPVKVCKCQNWNAMQHTLRVE